MLKVKINQNNKWLNWLYRYTSFDKRSIYDLNACSIFRYSIVLILKAIFSITVAMILWGLIGTVGMLLGRDAIGWEFSTWTSVFLYWVVWPALLVLIIYAGFIISIYREEIAEAISKPFEGINLPKFKMKEKPKTPSLLKTIYESIKDKTCVQFQLVDMEKLNRVHYINVDLDGVLADWESKFQTGGKASHEFNTVDEKWEHFAKQFNGGVGFYRDIPVYPGAKQFVQDLIELANKSETYKWEVRILTAEPSKIEIPNIIEDKVHWVRTMINPDIEVIVVQSSMDKQLFCNRGDILIDDNVININQWYGKGGEGVHHRGFEDDLEIVTVKISD